MNERRLPNDIDLLIIPQNAEISQEKIEGIKQRIYKISGLKADIEVLKEINNFSKKAIFDGMLLYGENVKGELNGIL